MSTRETDFSEFDYGDPSRARRRPRRRSVDPLDELLDGASPRPEREARKPSPGISAVLSVLAPGLGQVYCGRLGAGALWFLGTSLSYAAFFLPGFLVHALCVWSAYTSALHWRRW